MQTHRIRHEAPAYTLQETRKTHIIPVPTSRLQFLSFIRFLLTIAFTRLRRRKGEPKLLQRTPDDRYHFSRDHLPRRMCNGVENVRELECRKNQSIGLCEVFSGFAGDEFLCGSQWMSGGKER